MDEIVHRVGVICSGFECEVILIPVDIEFQVLDHGCHSPASHSAESLDRLFGRQAGTNAVRSCEMAISCGIVMHRSQIVLP